MAVDSYLELFTTLFGWHWFAGVWGALVSTGLALVPFIVIFLIEWKDAARAGQFGNVYELALRGIEIELYVATFVAAIAGPPLITLNASVITYEPPPTLANPTPTTVTPTSSGTTYGNTGAFSGAPGSVKIPLWWYTVLSLSKGINHSVMAAIPDTISVREIQQQARLATIPDSALRAEAGRFYAECYIPARSKYQREKPTVTTMLNEWGEDDPDWMGSHVYRTLYYGDMRSKNKVEGWPYDATGRDRDFDKTLPHVWGRPTCEEWWADSSNGIRAQIMKSSEASDLRNMMASASTQLASSFSTFTNASEKLNDKAARAALENSRVATMTKYQPDTLGVYERSGVTENVVGAAQDVAGLAGAGLTNFTIGTMLNSLKPMLPIIQSVILMMVYALLPLIIVFSKYSLGMLFTAGIGLFTIHFWTVLWKLAKWADDNLMVAMHPGTFDQLLSGLTQPGFIGGMTKDFMIDTMMAALMIGMPIIWSMMMMWVGIKTGNAINQSLKEGSGSSKQAGKAGGSLATGGRG